MGVRRIGVNGVELAVEEHGRGTRALVLVHGFTGSRRDFAPRLAALAELGRTLALDLRGHGDSGHARDPASYTLEQLADDVAALLAALELGPCDLLGHSMGGMVALRVALAHPQQVASLVLMDSAARTPDGIPRDTFALARQVARSAGMETLLRLMRERAPEDRGRTAADRRLEAEWGEAYWGEWRLPNFRSMDPEAYAGLGEAILAQPSLLPRLAELRCPTLVLVGEGDANFLSAADELAAGIPGARRADIAAAGHQPQLESPGAWLAALRDHLARVR